MLKVVMLCAQQQPHQTFTCRLSVIFNVQQDSGNGKLGLGEFATLWKKVQSYLVRRDL